MKYQVHCPSYCFRLSLIAALFLTFTVTATAQLNNANPPAFPGENGMPTLPDTQPQPAAADAQHQGEMTKQISQQLQQEIRLDTGKLLQLATELKQSVDKSSENTLSLDAVRKAGQIEKLAKTLENKMKSP